MFTLVCPLCIILYSVYKKKVIGMRARMHRRRLGPTSHAVWGTKLVLKNECQAVQCSRRT
jgi:hypothetical protein